MEVNLVSSYAYIKLLSKCIRKRHEKYEALTFDLKTKNINCNPVATQSR